MISLNDAQLKTVMATAAQVPYEKRAQFLERIVAMLALRGRSNSPTVMLTTWVGLVHESAA